MYFNFLPSIKYDLKPISYPFSESDYVVAKNFFRRYKISDTAFDSAVYYKKYAIGDTVRLDQIAEVAYGNPNYDWVVALVNNMINPLYDLPMSEAELRKHIESRYDNPYYDIHHYEIISDEQQEELFGKVLMPGGTVVDESFYNNRRTLTADTFPDLSPTSETITFTSDYVFSDTGFDNGFAVATDGSFFEPYGTGTGNNGGFVFPYPPLRNSIRSTGYLRFRSNDLQPRSVTFNPIDTRYSTSFTMTMIYGSNTNGGEYPDLPDELIRLQYRTDPSDEWTTIETIQNGVLQNIQFDGTPVFNPGFGGPGRAEDVYENVTLYYQGGTATNALVNVTVNSSGYITNIDFVDRGFNIADVPNLVIRNEDIGDAYWLDSEGARQYWSDVNLFNVSIFEEAISKYQYSRFGTEPFKYTIDLPEAARTETTEFRLYQPDNSGGNGIYDQYGIQSINISNTRTLVTETSIDYIQIDADNYVIEGVQWTRTNGTWYKVTEIGYRYHDNGQTIEISGSDLSRPVTEFEYESVENEKKREIYILKPAYLERLVDDFRKASLYKKSSDFVSNRLKKTGV